MDNIYAFFNARNAEREAWAEVERIEKEWDNLQERLNDLESERDAAWDRWSKAARNVSHAATRKNHESI